jgi:hypothetical protein
MDKIRSSILAAALFISSLASLSHAQEGGRIFFDMGYGLLSDYTRSPVTGGTERIEYYDSWSGMILYKDSTRYYQSNAFHLCSYVFRVRANALQPSDHMALSVSAMPSLQFGFVWENDLNKSGDAALSLMAVNLPLQAEFAFGAGSTFKTDKNSGGFLAGGYEFHASPLLDFDKEFKGKKSWGQPVFSTGYRFWLKANKLAELNLKIGLGKSQVTLPPVYTESPKGPLSIRLAFLYFINY